MKDTLRFPLLELWTTLESTNNIEIYKKLIKTEFELYMTSKSEALRNTLFIAYFQMWDTLIRSLEFWLYTFCCSLYPPLWKVGLIYMMYFTQGQTEVWCLFLKYSFAVSFFPSKITPSVSNTKSSGPDFSNICTYIWYIHFHRH